MKRYVAKLLCLSPIVILIVTVNYTMDPAHQFDADHAYEKGIARLLLDGAHVANIGHCNDRLVQKYFIQGLTKPRDVVIVGSSRSLQVQQEYFGGASAFNSSVSKATLEDYLAIYEMYHLRGLPPRVLILGLDPWILNDNNTVSLWRSLGQEIRSARLRMGLEVEDGVVTGSLASACDKCVHLLSLSYFQASVGELRRVVTRRDGSAWQEYYATDAIEADTYIKLADGSIRYPRAYETRSAAEVDQDAYAYANPLAAEYYGGFTTLSPEKMRTLEAFVDLLQKDGVRVVFFLPPYHPLAYERIMTARCSQTIASAHQYFLALAARKRLLVLGSYDPRDCCCDGADFLDGHHPRMSCLRKFKWEEASPEPKKSKNPLDGRSL